METETTQETTEEVITPTGGEQTPGQVENTDSATVEEPSGLEKRFSQLTGEIKGLKEQNAYLQGRMDSTTQAPAPEVIQEVAGPSRDDFETDQEFNLANQVHSLERNMESFKKDMKATEQRTASDNQFATMNSSYENARKTHDDFDQVINSPNMHVTQNILDAAMGDNVGEIIYHLQKNPAEAGKLQNLNGISLAREIGKLEAKLTFKPKKETTKAPPVPSTIGSNTSTTTPLESRPMNDKFAEWGKTEGKDWR